jgi:hypothetical protein
MAKICLAILDNGLVISCPDVTKWTEWMEESFVDGGIESTTHRFIEYPPIQQSLFFTSNPQNKHAHCARYHKTSLGSFWSAGHSGVSESGRRRSGLEVRLPGELAGLRRNPAEMTDFTKQKFQSERVHVFKVGKGKITR